MYQVSLIWGLVVHLHSADSECPNQPVYEVDLIWALIVPFANSEYSNQTVLSVFAGLWLSPHILLTENAQISLCIN